MRSDGPKGHCSLDIYAFNAVAVCPGGTTRKSPPSFTVLTGVTPLSLTMVVFITATSVAAAQRAAKSALNPSTMVGWERTASRSLAAGIPAIMAACTVPIISPASAARMVHPRIR